MPRYVANAKPHPLVRMCILVLALASTTTIGGCGLLGGSADEGVETAAPGGPEKSKIKVAVLPTTDIVPLYLAIDSGYFKQEGLEVEPIMGRSGSDCVAKMTSGEVDIAFSSYTPFFVAKAKNVSDIKLVADATSAGPGAYPVITVPFSPVKSISDMAGKRVGITAKLTMSHLMTASQLKVHGIDPDGIQWVELPFTAMAERLKKGDIDAAYIAEPFLQQAAAQVGAYPVFDTATGPTADIPLTGYGAITTFVNKYPKTLAAFQRVMKKATDEASTDRAKVDDLVQKIAKVDANTAHLAVPTHFVSSLDPNRIQRVVDLMLEFKALDKKIDVATMIVKPASG